MAHSNSIVAAAQEIGRRHGHRLWPVAVVCQSALSWAYARSRLAEMKASGAPRQDLKAQRARFLQAEELLAEAILEGKIRDDQR